MTMLLPVIVAARFRRASESQLALLGNGVMCAESAALRQRADSDSGAHIVHVNEAA